MEPWLADSEYNGSFDTSSITTINGTISSVGTFKPTPYALTGLALTVKTSDGRSLMVQCGPSRFMSRMGFGFKEGSDVTVTGSLVKSGGSTVIMATEIISEGRTLTLRDSEGDPLWMSSEAPREFPAPSPRAGNMKDYVPTTGDWE